MKQNRHYCINILSLFALVAMLHISTLCLGHFQVCTNISIIF
jgi:hypothetical protein